jgi:hypothetical protein
MASIVVNIYRQNTTPTVLLATRYRNPTGWFAVVAPANAHQSSKNPPHAHQLGALTEYSMIRRYEKGYEILTEQDLALALTMAESTLAWAKASVSPSPC